jgi:uncharacterized protein YecE (DUF72 family)
MTIRIGTAGWSIPRQVAAAFPAEGSSLERYAARLTAAEINSSFHRPHRQSTWQRWHDSVPESFRFSVKLPKSITHQAELVEYGGSLGEFLDQVTPLGEKLAVFLVQLPPKLAFDKAVAAEFFSDLAQRTAANIVCEPRHPSWFTAEADDLLRRTGVARVAADPAVCEAAALPGGSSRLRYWRLHGSPAMYRSSYEDRIGLYASRLRQTAMPPSETWCIFDNTASSAAAGDGLALMRAIEAS